MSHALQEAERPLGVGADGTPVQAELLAECASQEGQVRALSRIALSYCAIALVSSALNIAVQAAWVALDRGAHAIPLSMLAGTAACVPLKYVLEKRHVFGFRAQNLRHDGELLVLYAFFGVFTTLLFWGVEWLFQLAFHTAGMRYVGAAVGLALGFVLRYQLDRRFVFVARVKAAA